MKVYFYFYGDGQIAGSHIDESVAIERAQQRQGFVIDFEIPELYNYLRSEHTSAESSENYRAELVARAQRAKDHPEQLVVRDLLPAEDPS